MTTSATLILTQIVWAMEIGVTAAHDTGEEEPVITELVNR